MRTAPFRPLRPIALIAIAPLAIAFAAPAYAAELRDFCPNRPGLGTPACTIDPGHGDLEVGLADWTLDRTAGTRTDTLTFGSALVRYGLTDNLEAEIGWTAIGTQRQRDPFGMVQRQTGTGDVSIALRRNLSHPDGSGFSAAIMPFVTLPSGTAPLGAGTWGGGVIVPIDYQLPHGLQLAFTGQLAAAPNQDGHGRHLAYSSVVGLNADLGGKTNATLELEAARDEDPSGSSNKLMSQLSLAWKPYPDLQLDTAVGIGLAGQAPDVELSLGIARRF